MSSKQLICVLAFFMCAPMRVLAEKIQQSNTVTTTTSEKKVSLSSRKFVPQVPVTPPPAEDALVISDEDVSNTQVKEAVQAAVLEKYNPNAITFEYSDFAMEMFFKFQPEAFVGLWQNLLNHNYDPDRIWYIRHTADWKLVTHFGFNTFGFDVIRTQMTLRNKGVWGNTGSIVSTSNSPIKFGDVLIGDHNHFIPRFIYWMREAWIDILLNATSAAESGRYHHLTAGLFPFQLGNGIALGDAFAVNPGLLGFYTENAVDQFAPGIRIYGDATDTLKYDLYWAIIESRSDSLKTTGAQIYAQECGRRDHPERGFGNDNFILAGRLNYSGLRHDYWGALMVEPYLVYNRAPEQRVEFPADSSSQLATLGLALDYTNGDFALSIEGARNFGHQKVHCWDRNAIEFQFRDGVPTEVNSHVRNQDNQKVVFIRGSQAQQIIDASEQSPSQNGQPIGTTETGQQLFNAADRIRGCYENKYKGWMAIISMGYQVSPNVNWALEGGVASGDRNPNRVVGDDEGNALPDGDYRGFIGLQEVFSGKRIQSTYVLGSRRLPRPLSLPGGDIDQGVFADSVSEFTNIIYAGTGLNIKPINSAHNLSVRPNIIAFWEEFPSKKFNCVAMTVSNDCASPFLGVEINTFIDWYFFKNLRGYAVGSVFFPGQHYRDIRGTPLNKAQAAILAQADVTGFTEPLPLLWHDAVYTINVGLEYRY